MGILARNRPTPERDAIHGAQPGSASRATDNQRTSNGLKEFLWHLVDVSQGHLLDLGPIFQSTVDFFTGRRFKLYSNDLLRAWHDFLAQEMASRLTGSPKTADPSARAARFASTCLDYPGETFHGVLLWDLVDYLDPVVVPLFVARLRVVLRPGGAALAIFHSRAPEQFHRYRVLNGQTVESLPSVALLPFSRVLPNREILNLFSGFRSSKTFVGRDQIREALFTR